MVRLVALSLLLINTDSPPRPKLTSLHTGLFFGGLMGLTADSPTQAMLSTLP